MSVRYDHDENIRQAIRLEKEAVERLNAAIKVIATDLHWYWHWGDGEGGIVLTKLRDVVVGGGYVWPFDPKTKPSSPAKKAVISRTLSKSVFERDEYRCVRCGTHIDLCCDHIIPESKGGPTTLENLQAMCRPCNGRKGAKLA